MSDKFAAEKHLVRGQIISYSKPRVGKITVDIMSDYYSPYKNFVHIYTLRIVAGRQGLGKGSMITEAGSILYPSAKVLIDIPHSKKLMLINDKKCRKRKVTGNTKPPEHLRIKRPQ